jgi:hypothetical protein
MKTFRVHFKNGHSILITAHHFDRKLSPGTHSTVQFYKDEENLDETILVIAAEVAAIVLEAEAPAAAAGNVTRSSSGVRSR